MSSFCHDRPANKLRPGFKVQLFLFRISREAGKNAFSTSATSQKSEIAKSRLKHPVTGLRFVPCGHTSETSEDGQVMN
jgi:hypothetical protein